MVNVKENITMGNDHSAQQFSQLFIIPGSKKDMPENDIVLRVIPSGITSNLQHFYSWVFHHNGYINGGTKPNSFSISTLKISGHSSHGKLHIQSTFNGKRCFWIFGDC
ncbi:hypothetical protein SUGI_0518010 [Cryptomeria japonica]|nr:hypothetical protein SUGI_0518010 [Cryptomeria japonica]